METQLELTFPSAGGNHSEPPGSACPPVQSGAGSLFRTCSKCGNSHPSTTEFFYADSRCKSGLASKCKQCTREYGRFYYASHKTEAKEYYQSHKTEAKEYYQKNKDYFCKKASADQHKNRDRINKAKRAWRKNNKDKVRAMKHRRKDKTKADRKRYYERNKEKLLQDARTYFAQRNVEEYNARRRQYQQRKSRADPVYRMVRNLRARVHDVIARNNKSQSTLNLVGCSPDFLKQHLEAQFDEHMTWDNYGRYGWHIDHIIPCAVFDLTDPIEQKQCFHYTNLQPLWECDNLKKGAQHERKSN